MEKYLLGIDVGTTGTKTYLLTENGREIAHAYKGYEIFAPDTQVREQDPLDLWNAVVQTVREACQGVKDKENIAAISMSTQGGTLVPVDGNFNPVHNAIVWNDVSCGAEKERFVAEQGDIKIVYNKTGWNLGFGLPLLQARKLHDNQPELFAKIKYFLSVPDFISVKMTGIPAVDMSNAGINQFTDIRLGKHDKALCEFAKVKEEQLPKLVKSCEVIGKLTPTASQELGLCEHTVLTGGAHDQYAVALGAGIINDGEMLIGSGTSWVVTSMGSTPDFESGLAQSVAAVEGKWGSILSMSYGGACLEWLRKNIAVGKDGEIISYDELNEKGKEAKGAENGLTFYPFLGKLSDKTTSNNSRAMFIGLDASHDRYDMIRAIMEGVAFQIKWMSEAFSTQISEKGIKLAGGASKSPLWSQIIADVLNRPVIIPSIPDMACVGAAIMAGVGAGIYANAQEGYEKMTQTEKKIYPDEQRVKMYAEAFEKYKANAALIAQLK